MHELTKRIYNYKEDDYDYEEDGFDKLITAYMKERASWLKKQRIIIHTNKGEAVEIVAEDFDKEIDQAFGIEKKSLRSKLLSWANDTLDSKDVEKIAQIAKAHYKEHPEDLK